MKKFVWMFALSTILVHASSQADAALLLQFSSVSGAGIEVDPTDPGPGLTGTFDFKPATSGLAAGFDFGIDLSFGGTGDSVGLVGNLGGVWNIGTISVAGGVQSAPASLASGLANFEIFDGVDTFSATVDWIEIRTAGGITTAGLNAEGKINVTAATYTGANADLNQLRDEINAGAGLSAISFQFTPPKSLTALTTAPGPSISTFSGNITSVPGPAGIILVMVALPVVGGSYWNARRRKISQLA